MYYIIIFLDIMYSIYILYTLPVYDVTDKLSLVQVGYRDGLLKY